MALTRGGGGECDKKKEEVTPGTSTLHIITVTTFRLKVFQYLSRREMTLPYDRVFMSQYRRRDVLLCPVLVNYDSRDVINYTFYAN